MSRLTNGIALLTLIAFANTGLAQRSLSKPDLRDIDTLALKLTKNAEELHDEFHEHLERVKHAVKLEEDVSEMEKIAVGLHDFAHDADGGEQTMRRIRADTNRLLQLSSQIEQTVERAKSWTRTSHGRIGISHMRSAAADVVRLALLIDARLPVDTGVIDAQADRLEGFVKELHDEFHEHLEGYEMSRHLDEDLENLEIRVEHIHDIAHNKRWENINFKHVLSDLSYVKKMAEHVEYLLDRQSRIGVRTKDFIGIEHSRDAMTDVIASVYLLEHMIFKADPSLNPNHRRLDRHHNGHTDRHGLSDRGGLSDRDGHGLDSHRPRRDRLHEDHLDRIHGGRSDRLPPSDLDRIRDVPRNLLPN